MVKDAFQNLVNLNLGSYVNNEINSQRSSNSIVFFKKITLSQFKKEVSYAKVLNEIGLNSDEFCNSIVDDTNNKGNK